MRITWIFGLQMLRPLSSLRFELAGSGFVHRRRALPAEGDVVIVNGLYRSTSIDCTSEPSSARKDADVSRGFPDSRYGPWGAAFLQQTFRKADILVKHLGIFRVSNPFCESPDSDCSCFCRSERLSRRFASAALMSCAGNCARTTGWPFA